MTVTIKDVARLAGVSPATVSRALSTPDLVRAETCERVRRAAAGLGYSPNRSARGLITGRTGILGLVVPDLANPYFPAVVKGVLARAREEGHAVFIADTDEDTGAEADVVRAIAREVDGLILCAPRAGEAALRPVLGDRPVVLLNRRLADVPAVTFDHRGGMRQAVAHLRALGHRTIAYAGGPSTSWAHHDRLAALRAVTAAAGVRLVELGSGEPQFSGGVAAADGVRGTGATAVIAYNDVVALGLISRLATLGVAVPDQVSVIGFDDIALSATVHPSLTTVATPMEASGRAGVDLLLHLMRHPGRPAAAARALGTHLRVRDSTGPAPAPGRDGPPSSVRPECSN